MLQRELIVYRLLRKISSSGNLLPEFRTSWHCVVVYCCVFNAIYQLVCGSLYQRINERRLPTWQCQVTHTITYTIIQKLHNLLTLYTIWNAFTTRNGLTVVISCDVRRIIGEFLFLFPRKLPEQSQRLVVSMTCIFSRTHFHLWLSVMSIVLNWISFPFTRNVIVT